MATNHFALYCAITNDQQKYKIGMTQQTKRAREQNSDFIILGYADFKGVFPFRDLLFKMEDFLRQEMDCMYNRCENKRDYYEAEDSEFLDNFIFVIESLLHKLKQIYPSAKYELSTI